MIVSTKYMIYYKVGSPTSTHKILCHFWKQEFPPKLVKSPLLVPVQKEEKSIPPLVLRFVSIIFCQLRLDLSFQSLRQIICISGLYHTCYMPYPSHYPGFYHANNVLRRVQFMELLGMQFSSNSSWILLLRYKYTLSTLLSKTFCLHFKYIRLSLSLS
jgi:hypothetical protein